MSPSHISPSTQFYYVDFIENLKRFSKVQDNSLHTKYLPLLIFTCLKSTIETLEKGVKYAQS